MKPRRLYSIDILNLNHGSHDYEFDIDSSFFEGFEDSLIEKGKLKVTVTLNISETLIQTSFVIDGYVELICDRSLENFNFPVSVNEQIIFKFGSEYSELTDEIITIPRDLQSLNVAQYIYEFIGLAVPIKKLHPRFVEEDEDEEETTTEGVLIYTTKKEEDEEEDQDGPEEKTDPRWAMLNNIKKNLN